MIYMKNINIIKVTIVTNNFNLRNPTLSVLFGLILDVLSDTTIPV